MQIQTTRQLISTLKEGPYVWPGGYPLFFGTHDGDVVSFQWVRDNALQVCREIRAGFTGRISYAEINYENLDMICVETNQEIEAAYTA